MSSSSLQTGANAESSPLPSDQATPPSSLETQTTSLDTSASNMPSSPGSVQPLPASVEADTANAANAGESSESGTNNDAEQRLKTPHMWSRFDEGFPRFMQEIKELRDNMVQEVRRSSIFLGEIADPENSKSQKELLLAAHGENALMTMSDGEKDVEHKRITSNRIAERERVTFESAQALLNQGGPNIVRRVLEEKESAKALGQQATEAAKSKAEVAGVHEYLKVKLSSLEDTLSSCEHHKRTSVNEQLIAARLALKEALLQFKMAEAAYQEKKIQDLALSLRIDKLKDCVRNTKDQLERVEASKEAADEKCDLWLRNAQISEKEVNKQIAVAASQVVSTAWPSTQEQALNIKLAMECLKKLVRDKQFELESLEDEQESFENKMENMKTQLKTDNPDDDVSLIRTTLAKKKDEHNDCLARIEACKKKLDELSAALQKAEMQYKDITDLEQHRVDNGSVSDSVPVQITESAASYDDFRLHRKRKSICFASPQRPISEAGALQAMGPDFEDMFKKAVQAAAQQLVADQFFRGQRGATSEVGSEWEALSNTSAATPPRSSEG